MNETTIVLPSARAIRQQQLALETQTLFLPNYITISELISKLCIVDAYKIADEDTRVILLLEAAHFQEFSKLQIERNFFTFTKNSSYIFKFFEEISAELYDINDLDTSDIYAEYEEHIQILQELYKRYEAICNEKKILDKIFLPKLYTFNIEYAKRVKKLEIYVDGHLSNFELELLEKMAQYTQIDMIITTTKFNTKMQDKLGELGIELHSGYEYTIDYNKKEVKHKNKTTENKAISCEAVSEGLLQIAFIKKKIYDFMEKGYEAKNIAVILPDESLAEMLKHFDTSSNLNFAMGESFTQTLTYKKLKASVEYIEQDSKENYARLIRVGDELYVELLPIYYTQNNAQLFIEFLEKYAQEIKNPQEKKILNAEIYSFSKILEYVKEMSVKSLLHIFLQRLSSKTLDDVRGGKITVMGVLETRSVVFDGVIIVDFNDANVPKRSDKDMFLNTKIREFASLPTMSDRENLQKHYYEMLIQRSKEVAISYIKSEQSSPSRFLKQLGIEEQSRYSEHDWANILFASSLKNSLKSEEIVLEYSFKNQKLSNTKLKTYLTCKRKYYYKYIRYIQNHTIPKDMPQEWEIGSAIHSALSNLYSKKSFYTSVDSLRKDLEYELDGVCGESELEKYLISLHKKRFGAFVNAEIQRFNDGWRVESCEEKFEVNFCSLDLVGQVDRIDRRGDALYVLDYKTGKYPLYNAKNYHDATDFQLEFYYLFLKGKASSIECGYYDLKESKIVPEVLLAEKLAILESNIQDLLALEEIDFSLCEDTKHCQYCEYKIMCQRA